MKFSIAKGKTTLIDKSDYDMVSKYRWNYNNGAVCTNIKVGERRTTMKLHRYLLGLKKGYGIVDHINGNPLDNRRSNLRLCNNAQNKSNADKHIDNKSGYKGVSWAKHAGKWQATIGANNKQYYLGLYDDPKEAYKAYVEAAKKYHKEYAKC